MFGILQDKFLTTDLFALSCQRMIVSDIVGCGWSDKASDMHACAAHMEADAFNAKAWQARNCILRYTYNSPIVTFEQNVAIILSRGVA